MLRKILSVGGWTLLSRVTGFLRDILLAAILGAGPLMDAFTVANRLPNHFRVIFGETSFNAAFQPVYAQVLHDEGGAGARRFSGQIAAVLGLAVTAVTVAAILFMPQVVGWLAPGFERDPAQFELAVALTRVTFPYLTFITLAMLVSAVLNSHERFAAAGAAQSLLNVSVIAALAIAALFPSAAHAAAWGVTASGLLQLALVWWDARRSAIAPLAQRPRLDAPVRRFLKILLPATLGSAGVQIALFVDTILVTLLGPGAPSSVYYADRIYQLPIGVIAIAAGTVVLPEMSRRFASGDAAGAHRAQNRALSFILALALPTTVAFLVIPDLIMSALFVRGAFTAADASAAAAVLAAYAVGLPAVVLIRSTSASFNARGDTRTPAIVAFLAVVANIALKLVLIPQFGTPGLAFATAFGAWLNVAMLYGLALRKGWTEPDRTLRHVLSAALAGSVVLAAAGMAMRGMRPSLPPIGDIGFLALLCIAGSAAYGAAFLGLLRLLGTPLPALRRGRRP